MIYYPYFKYFMNKYLDMSCLEVLYTLQQSKLQKMRKLNFFSWNVLQSY